MGSKRPPRSQPKRRDWGSIHRRKDRLGNLLPGFFLTYSWRDADGRPRRATVKVGETEEEAERGRIRLRDQVLARQRRRLIGQVPIFLEFLAERYFDELALRISKSTYATAKVILLRAGEHFGAKEIDHLTRADVLEFLGTVKGRNGQAPAPSTLKQHLHTLATAFDSAIELGHLEVNPTRRIRIRRAQQTAVPYLAKADLERLYAAVPAEIRPAIVLLGETGLRLGELHGLTWADLSPDRRRIRVVRSKNRATREVPLTETAQRVVVELVRASATAEAEDSVFVGRAGCSRSGLLHAFQRAAKAEGFGHLRLHDLRHACATRLVRHGVPPQDVAAWLGHSSPGLVVSRYGSHAPANALDRALGHLEAAERGGAAGA